MSEEIVGTGEVEFDMSAGVSDISESLFGTSEAAPGEGEGLEGVAAPEAGESAPQDAAPAPEAAAPVAEVPPPPRTWKPEVAAKWAAIDPEVRQEILRREENIFQGIEAYKSRAEFGDRFQRTLQPYMQTLQQYNLDPLQQVGNLLQAHHILSLGTPEQKQMMFARIAADYGINTGGETPYVDPQVAALQRDLQNLQSRLSSREQSEAANIRAGLQREIETFAADPAHVYFNEVANDIAGLLKSGVARDLKDAYERAVWANPVTRSKEQARVAAETAKKSAEEAAARAAAAKKATSANVQSSAKAASGTAPRGTIEDTMQATLAAIRSRA